MTSVLAFLERPEIALALSLLGLAATVLGIVLTVRSRQKRELRWGVVHLAVIDGETKRVAPRLEATYEKISVDTLSRARIAIWNAGNDAIRRADLASADPLRIKLSDDNNWLLGAVASSTQNAINAVVQPATNSTPPGVIDFDFFNPREGVLVEVFHRGLSTDRVELVGTLVGAEITEVSLQLPKPTRYAPPGALSDRIGLALSSGLIVVGVLALVYLAIYEFITGQAVATIAVAIVAAVFAVLGTWIVLSYTRRLLPHRLYGVYEGAVVWGRR